MIFVADDLVKLLSLLWSEFFLVSLEFRFFVYVESILQFLSF